MELFYKIFRGGNFLADRPYLRRKAVASKIMEGKKRKVNIRPGFLLHRISFDFSKLQREVKL